MSTFANILSEVADLKEKKSQDYQGSSIKQSEYFPYGQVSFNHMLWTKILRIRSVSEQDGEQNYESLEDSLKDLIAYATMNIEWIREQETVTNTDTYQDLDAEWQNIETDYLRGKIGTAERDARQAKLKGTS